MIEGHRWAACVEMAVREDGPRPARPVAWLSGPVPDIAGLLRRLLPRGQRRTLARADGRPLERGPCRIGTWTGDGVRVLIDDAFTTAGDELAATGGPLDAVVYLRDGEVVGIVMPCKE